MNIYLHQNNTWVLLPLLVCCILTSNKATAQQADTLSSIPISTNRPSISQGAGVVPKGTIQAEIGISYYKDKPDETELKAHTYPDVLIRYGLFNRLELQLLSSLQDSVVNKPQIRRKVQGIGPVSVGVVGHLLKEDTYIPSVAVINTLTLPIGDKDFRPKHAQPSIIVAASKGIGNDSDIVINWGYSWSGGDPTNHFILSLGTTLNDSFSVYAEAARDKPQGENAAYIADVGVLWLLKHNLQLDIAVGRQLNNLATDFFATTGVSFRLPN